METIALSLVSHTNVGKTTLARTLLRRDVGEVFDQAHVTEVNESWPLVETPEARLLLWDTPGLGDSARLLKRLRREGDPVGWFLHQVWDRITDRPLWSSQQALRNIREDADVVLYLVNAAEDPVDAGYVELELQLLERLGRPVVVLLNQTGGGDDRALVARWREFAAGHPVVRDVLTLDAFTRSWVQEPVLLRRVAALLPPDRRAVMESLIAVREQRDVSTFSRCVDAMARAVAETAADREPLPSAEASAVERKRASAALAERVEARLARLMDALIAEHGLDGKSAAKIHERMEDVRVHGAAPLTTRGGAIWGGILSGAASGLAADLAAGGLSFGGGLVLGALAGALGGAGLARGVRLAVARGQPAVAWERDFLEGLVRGVLLRYLAVAQFGRGRGAFHDDVLAEGERSLAAWSASLSRALAPRAESLRAVWDMLGVPARGSVLLRPKLREKPDTEAAARRLGDITRDTLRDVLCERHPEAAELFAS